MKSYIPYRTARSERSETVVYASLGVVGLFSVILAVLSMLDFVSEKDDVLTAWSSNSARSGPVRYFSSGQWLADARTLAAMSRYLLDPDTEMPTNLTRVGANTSTPSLTLPTNSTCCPPKA